MRASLQRTDYGTQVDGDRLQGLTVAAATTENSSVSASFSFTSSRALVQRYSYTGTENA